jgi:hypothetical protein
MVLPSDGSSEVRSSARRHGRPASRSGARGGRCAGLVPTFVTLALALTATAASAGLVFVDFNGNTDGPLSLYLDQGTVTRSYPGSGYRLTSPALGSSGASVDPSLTYSDFSIRVKLPGEALDLDRMQNIGVVAYASTTELDGYRVGLDPFDFTLRLERLDDGVPQLLAQTIVTPAIAWNADYRVVLRRIGSQLSGSVIDYYGVSTDVSASDATYGSVQVGLFAESAAGETLDATVDDFAASDDGADADGDSVADSVDNCPFDPNGPFDDIQSQRDEDMDGIGTRCDCDFNQDGLVLGDDLYLMVSQIGGSIPPPVYDLTGDGLVLGDDLLICYGKFNSPAG